jgi:hypothetical protein
MSANTSDENVSITPDLLELSGDFGFRPTGVIEVDMLLVSIVAAGKAYGHTKSWLTSSAAQWIQMRADSCADAIRGKSANRCSAKNTKTVLDALDSIASTFQDSDIKGATVLIRAQSAELASQRARLSALEHLKDACDFAIADMVDGQIRRAGQVGIRNALRHVEEMTAERAKEGETRK